MFVTTMSLITNYMAWVTQVLAVSLVHVQWYQTSMNGKGAGGGKMLMTKNADYTAGILLFHPPIAKWQLVNVLNRLQQITLVKKILADGSACRKCKDILDRLERDNYINYIDRIVIADERA